jgi:hypothetical protein
MFQRGAALINFVKNKIPSFVLRCPCYCLQQQKNTLKSKK